MKGQAGLFNSTEGDGCIYLQLTLRLEWVSLFAINFKAGIQHMPLKCHVMY